jgi:lysophospholipase L1-like esterase
MTGIGRLAGTAIAAAILSLAALAPAAIASEGSGGVLVVGDSLEELTSPYLARYLPGVPLTVNAKGGYNSYEILELFEESYDPSQSVIVFDAGTNDNPSYPQILAENLSKVAATVGNRCMVVPTIHGLHPGGVSDAGKNRTVAEFAASRPGTEVPEWAGFVAAHPELMQADNLHPIEAGAQARARLIAQGVLGCLGEGGGSGAAATSSSGPVLADKPEHLPQADTISEREETLVAAIANEVISQALVRVGARNLALGLPLGAMVYATLRAGD